MKARFHDDSWWAYDAEFDSDTGPYSTEEQAQEWIGGIKCRHTYTKCWGGYHCLDCMTYFPGMIRKEARGVINWDVSA